MRTPQTIKTLLNQSKGMSFFDKCAYINTLKITLNEVRQINVKSLRKLFPIKLSDLSFIVVNTPKELDGYFEITTVHNNSAFDYGFMLTEPENMLDEMMSVTSEPPSEYNPLTYQYGLR